MQDHLHEVLDEELEYHMSHEHGLIMDQILLGDGIKDIAAASRSFVRCAQHISPVRVLLHPKEK